MAILDRPLFGDEARGRIKNTLVFLKRVANLGYTGLDPGERFIINHLKAFKQSKGTAREDWKEKFKDGVEEWKALSPAQKQDWNLLVTGLLTGFNVFISEYLFPTPPPQSPGFMGGRIENQDR